MCVPLENKHYLFIINAILEYFIALMLTNGISSFNLVQNS